MKEIIIKMDVLQACILAVEIGEIKPTISKKINDNISNARHQIITQLTEEEVAKAQQEISIEVQKRLS